MLRFIFDRPWRIAHPCLVLGASQPSLLGLVTLTLLQPPLALRRRLYITLLQRQRDVTPQPVHMWTNDVTLLQERQRDVTPQPTHMWTHDVTLLQRQRYVTPQPAHMSTRDITLLQWQSAHINRLHTVCSTPCVTSTCDTTWIQPSIHVFTTWVQNKKF